jgi:hypothetical protein
MLFIVGMWSMRRPMGWSIMRLNRSLPRAHPMGECLLVFLDQDSLTVLLPEHRAIDHRVQILIQHLLHVHARAATQEGDQDASILQIIDVYELVGFIV